MRAVFRADAADLDEFLRELRACPRVRRVRPAAAPLPRGVLPLGESFGVRTRPLIDNDDVDLFVYTLPDTHVFEHLRRMYGSGTELSGTALWFDDGETRIECVEVIPVCGALGEADEARVGARLKATCGFTQPGDMDRFAQVLVRLDLTYRSETDEDEETWALLVAIDEVDDAVEPMLARLEGRIV